MKSGQPALLYLVPSVLIPVSIIALMRGQFRSLWDGKVVCILKFSCIIRINQLHDEWDSLNCYSEKSTKEFAPQTLKWLLYSRITQDYCA